MNAILMWLKNFMSDEEGATAVEYGVLIALIIALCVVIIAVLGKQIREGFSQVSAALTAEGIGGS